MGNHNDSTNVTFYFGAVAHPQEMAYLDGEQNTEADYPRTGLKYVTEGGPTSSHTTVERSHCSPSSLVRAGERSVTMIEAMSAEIGYSNLQSQAKETDSSAATVARRAT